MEYNLYFIKLIYNLFLYSIFQNIELVMDLRPQDLVVILKLLAHERVWTYAKLGGELSISASQAFRSVQCAESAHLLRAPSLPPPPDRSGLTRPTRVLQLVPDRTSLKEFLVHGAKYAFPVHRGGLVRGIPTAHAASPLREQLGESFDPPPVWPYADGTVRGTEFSPLYKNVPQAALRDPQLYELLALVDAIRDGRAREREIAVRELVNRIDTL